MSRPPPLRLTLALLVAPLAATAQAPDTVPYRDALLPVDARVRDLLARMTLEETYAPLSES